MTIDLRARAGIAHRAGLDSQNTEPSQIPFGTAAHALTNAVDAEHAGKPASELATLPTTALTGISDADAAALAAQFSIHTIGDLGRHGPFVAAQAIAGAAEPGVATAMKTYVIELDPVSEPPAFIPDRTTCEVGDGIDFRTTNGSSVTIKMEETTIKEPWDQPVPGGWVAVAGTYEISYSNKGGTGTGSINVGVGMGS